MNIRLFQEKDKESIRQISYETALKGESAEHFFRDREVLADILIKYYTDYEPEFLLVAEADNKIIGYLTGCVDTKKYLKRIKKMILFIFLKALIRGDFFYISTWKLIIAAIKVFFNKGFELGIDLNKYPAHLHINIIKEYRGKKIGRVLLDSFFKMLENRKIKGLHLSVRQDNLNGRTFFEKAGFIELERYPSLFTDKKTGKLVYTLIYGKKF